MAASIQSTVLPLDTSTTIGTVARKRRRQILESQRSPKSEIHGDLSVPEAKKMCILDAPENDALLSVSPDDIVSSFLTFPRKISDAANVSEDTGSDDDEAMSSTSSTGSSMKPKRPQMRYEPDVPMSKEAAAAWRREQRRKRNRESAAASRQRQRDRITELEAEVDDWKEKFDAAVERLRKLETLSGVEPLDLEACGIATRTEGINSSVEPPSDHCSVPLETFSDALHLPGDKDTELLDSLDLVQLEENEQHLNEKISRPA
jgi:hypothetical protein